MKKESISSAPDSCSSCTEECGIAASTMSRRKFLGRGAIAVGAAGATVVATGGVGLLTNTLASAYSPPPPPPPPGGTCAATGAIKHPKGTWGYPSGGLDPDACAERAYHSYRVGHCAYAVIDGVIGTLQDQLGSPYTNIDPASFIFLWGGLNGWGTACGTVVGAGITVNLIADGLSLAMSEELTGYYAITDLPLYVPVTNDYKGTDPRFVTGGTFPQNTPNTPLCHVSIGKWMTAAGVTDFWSDERTERCGRVAATMARRTVELLNAWKAGTYVYGGMGDQKTPAIAPFYPSPAYNVGAIGRPAQQDCSDCHK